MIIQRGHAHVYDLRCARCALALAPTLAGQPGKIYYVTTHPVPVVQSGRVVVVCVRGLLWLSVSTLKRSDCKTVMSTEWACSVAIP